MLQNERVETVLSNGFVAMSSTEGVISYDFSGQVNDHLTLVDLFLRRR